MVLDVRDGMESKHPSIVFMSILLHIDHLRTLMNQIF